jgi:hypothetical protein
VINRFPITTFTCSLEPNGVCIFKTLVKIINRKRSQTI